MSYICNFRDLTETRNFDNFVAGEKDKMIRMARGRETAGSGDTESAPVSWRDEARSAGSDVSLPGLLDEESECSVSGICLHLGLTCLCNIQCSSRHCLKQKECIAKTLHLCCTPSCFAFGQITNEKFTRNTYNTTGSFCFPKLEHLPLLAPVSPSAPP